MLKFKKPELSDRAEIERLLAYSDFFGCEYCFSNNYLWRDVYGVTFAVFKDFYIVKADGGFFFPAGRGDYREVMKEIEEYCRENDLPFVISSAEERALEILRGLYGDKLIAEENRDYFDYIYSREKLSTLAGKKLHSKRNHLNRFRENSWSYEPITENNLSECLELNRLWTEEGTAEKPPEQREDILAESRVVSEGLNSFFELGLIGGLLRVEGKPIAFTFGHRVSDRVFDIHAEKALKEYQGAYPAINYEFVNNALGGYEYINREEDTGAENLRKAKLSYYPEFLLKKYIVRFL